MEMVILLKSFLSLYLRMSDKVAVKCLSVASLGATLQCWRVGQGSGCRSPGIWRSREQCPLHCPQTVTRQLGVSIEFVRKCVQME